MIWYGNICIIKGYTYLSVYMYLQLSVSQKKVIGVTVHLKSCRMCDQFKKKANSTIVQYILV